MTTETKNESRNDLFDMARAGMETIMWGQDQAEALVRTGLEQAHTVRHESHKVLVALLDQAKANQEELNRKAEENLRSALELVPGMGAFLKK